MFQRNFVKSIPALRDSNSEKMTFREWCSYSTPTGWFPRLCGMTRNWEVFLFEILLPLFSGVCTAPEDDVFEYPVQEFLGNVHIFAYAVS